MAFHFVRSISAAVLVLAGSSFGAITANFDGAAGDGYPGTAGNGWGGGWVSTASGSSSASYSSGVGSAYGAMSTGGGSYLGNDYTVTGSGYHVLSRQYVSSPAQAVDLTQAHVFSFKFRLDSLPSDYKNSPDSLYFDDDSVNGSFFTSTPTWIFGFNGFASGSIPARRFTVVDGNRTGTGTSVDTGIDVVQGVVYTFTVTSNPSTRSYDFTMSNGTGSFTRTDLGWRSDVTAVGGNFNILGRTNLSSGARHFDIDSVRIAAVPEPGLVAMTALTGLTLLRRRR